MNKDKPYNPYEKWYSISATEDHINCPRRRWLKKTCKIPVQQSTPTVFGDIGHKCNERFLMADDRGMDATGRPVNLFPDGWRTMESRFGKDKTKYTITEEEGALIKTLINKSITEGKLIREPGRQIELEFEHKVHKEGKYSIKLIGFIDLENPNEVLDHKFVKNMNFALSTKKGAKRDIRKSVQMMTYAMSKYLRGHKGNLYLSLLYHIKDYEKPAIQKRSVEITKFEVEQFFNSYTLPHMKKMLAIDMKYPKSRVLDLLLVPGPDDPVQECNRHYGKPCPFIGVCLGHFSVQQYLTTFGMDVNDLINSDKQESGNSMTNALTNLCKQEIEAVAGSVAGATAGAVEIVSQTGVTETEVPLIPEPAAPATTGLASLGIGTAPPVVEPVKAAVVETAIAPVAAAVETVAEVPAAAPTKQRAPWFFDYLGQGCNACNDSHVQGYNKDKVPCAACDARNGLNNLHPSSHYNAVSDTEGVITFTLKPEFAGGQVAETAVQVVSEPVVKEVTVMAEAVVETAVDMTVAKDTGLESLVGGAASLGAIPAEVPTKEPVKPLLNPRGFTMMIGCSVVKGICNTLSSDDILAEALKDISTATGKPAAEIEHFSLLQAIDACIPDIVGCINAVGDHNVICFPSTKGSAMDRLVEGLRIHAHTVIAPIGI